MKCMKPNRPTAPLLRTHPFTIAPKARHATTSKSRHNHKPTNAEIHHSTGNILSYENPTQLYNNNTQPSLGRASRASSNKGHHLVVQNSNKILGRQATTNLSAKKARV
uniref:Uncharacterized protein n=1 Tax=Physcomitrium patens TaxID=3218 RepID=A0A2K1ICS1_PHYPA|nr:hypothetical protein PHYPA_030548 [Physcomitrium patens]